jgi:D-alanyl-D-alanine carboxypeptidase
MSMPADAPRGYHPVDESVPLGGEFIDITEQDPSWTWTAGQMVSTPSEINEFFTALLGGKLLGPEMLAEMKKTVPAKDVSAIGGNEYGLGIMTVKLSCGVEAWGHGGDIQGYSTRNVVTADGRSASLAATSLSVTMEGLIALEDAVDAAICE